MKFGWIAAMAAMACFVAIGPAPARDRDDGSGGSAGGGAAINSDIPRCPHTYGDVAIRGVDASLTSLLRRYVLQSNCLRITSQLSGRSEGDMDAVRDQGRGGEFRPSSRHGKNNRVGSNYYFETTVNFSNESGTHLNIGGFLGGLGNLVGGTDVHSGSATVTLELWDANAQVLISSATGKSSHSSMDMPFTASDGDPRMRAIDSATLDAFRQIVPALNNYRQQNIDDGHLGVE
ncbi:MAG TPA: hypothetical protein VHZ78_12080 [Rhizomicrobium sp.]|jgi:hypothetical protein|nr:hypothetical protein [Rhizomicrobium sp.]